MGKVSDVTAGSFEEEVVEVDGVVVVEFWGPNCVHCERFGPKYEGLPDLFGEGTRFVRVNALQGDDGRGLAMRSGVQVVPTLKVFYRGVIVGEVVGDRPLDEVVESLKEIINNKERCIARSTPIKGK